MTRKKSTRSRSKTIGSKRKTWRTSRLNTKLRSKRRRYLAGTAYGMLGIPARHWLYALFALEHNQCDLMKIRKSTYDLVSDVLNVNKRWPVFQQYLKDRNRIQKAFAAVYNHCKGKMTI